jgi:hypothetical protein
MRWWLAGKPHPSGEGGAARVQVKLHLPVPCKIAGWGDDEGGVVQPFACIAGLLLEIRGHTPRPTLPDRHRIQPAIPCNGYQGPALAGAAAATLLQQQLVHLWYELKRKLV